MYIVNIASSHLIMEPWSISDVCIMIVSGLLILTFEYGIIQLMLLNLAALPFFLLRLPIRIFMNYYVKSWETKLPFARRAGLFEFSCVETMRWLLSNLNADVMGRNLMFSRRVFLWMYYLRKFRYGIDEIGDTYFESVDTELFNGYWLRSHSRFEAMPKVDLVVLYAPGNILGFASAYAYLEYLSLLLTSLIEQGFENPVIFCIDIDWIQGYGHEINKTGFAWQYACTQCPGAVKVLMGDGPGATVLLSVMLHIQQPLKGLTPLYDGSHVITPDAALLISPLAKIAKSRITNENDWLTNAILSRFAVRTIAPEESKLIYTMPGLLYSSEWWEKAIPKLGLYISYGQEETCAPEIELMGVHLKDYGKVILEAEPANIHAWPITQVYIGRSKLSRTRGTSKLASQLAFMSLWFCQTGAISN